MIQNHIMNWTDCSKYIEEEIRCEEFEPHLKSFKAVTYNMMHINQPMCSNKAIPDNRIQAHNRSLGREREVSKKSD